MTNHYDLAFPTTEIINDIDGNEIGKLSHKGLTKREHFALTILSGLEASNFENSHQSRMKPRESVDYAVFMAELLIEALNKPKR